MKIQSWPTFLIRCFLLLAVMVVFFLVGRTSCFAVEVVLQWDESSDPDVVGYKVHYKADSSLPPFNGTGAVEGASPLNIGNRTTANISGLGPGRSYYFAVTAYNAAGVESFYSNVAAIHPLTITLTGSGSGSVNSDAGIFCIGSTCTPQFMEGSSVTLIAAPSNSTTALSFFRGWTGGCSSTSGTSCSVTMDSLKSVTAAFSANPPVRIRGGAYYPSLQSALTTAGTGAVLEAQAVTLIGNVSVNGKSNVSIKGGYNATYSGTSEYTEIVGVLTVAKGNLSVDKLIIR